jgi:hypothetical protein
MQAKIEGLSRDKWLCMFETSLLYFWGALINCCSACKVTIVCVCVCVCACAKPDNCGMSWEMSQVTMGWGLELVFEIFQISMPAEAVARWEELLLLFFYYDYFGMCFNKKFVAKFLDFVKFVARTLLEKCVLPM